MARPLGKYQYQSPPQEPAVEPAEDATLEGLKDAAQEYAAENEPAPKRASGKRD